MLLHEVWARWPRSKHFELYGIYLEKHWQWALKLQYFLEGEGFASVEIRDTTL